MDISFAFRKIQKSIAGLSILAVLASLVSFTGIASADTFPDVDSDHYAYDAVDAASDEGWMTGYDNGDFGVDDTLTRGQAAKLLVAGSDLDTVDGCETDFTDVPTSYSLYDYVCSAEAYGFVGGYTDSDGDATGEYGPNDSVNRAQFAKMVVEAFGLASVDEALDEFPDVDEGVWYEESDTWYVSTAWAWSVVNGYDNGNYYPSYDVTRGQAAIMINNAQEPEWRVDEDEEEDTTSDGDLTVEVSSESPDAMTIPDKSTSVVLAAWDFTANGGDVTVDSLSVHHYGISTLASGHQVYLYEGSTRLTSGTTVGSTNNEATFTYDIEVAEGETRTISVRMDMGDRGDTGEVGLEIASASAIDAGDATVDGDFPAQGAKHTISTTEAGSVTIEKNGTVDNSQVGEDGTTIGKFKITSATEAAGVEELGIYLSGSLNTADVENFALYVVGADDEPIAEVASVDDLDVIRFDIEGEFDSESDECENSDGYCIAKGGSKSFYVTADFNTGRTDDTVKLYVDQSTDVYAKGALYGSGMQVTRTAYDGDSCTASTGDCSYSVLEGGDITVTSNGPAAGDIATNARDVSLLDFSIVSVTDVTFDSFPISLTGTEGSDADEGLWEDSTDTANFTDVKIVNTDTDASLFAGVDSSVFKTAIAGAVNIADGTDGAIAYHLFTDNFEMSAGEELNLALTTDVRNDTALDGMTLVGALDLGATYPQLKDSNNKSLTNSAVLVPASAVTGKTMTVRTPSLALSLASTPVSGATSYVKGSQDVPFTGIVMACGNASDCRITSVSLVGAIDADNDAVFASTASTPGVEGGVNVNTVVGSVWLEDDDGNVVAGPESVTTSTGAVTLDNMDFTIDAGDSPVLTVVGDVKSSVSTAVDNVAFKITAASSVVVEDEEGNTITATGTVNHPTVTTASTYVSVTNGGSLTVSVDASTARENIAVSGSTGVEISTFKFTTTAEGFTVQKLAFNTDQNDVLVGNVGEYDNQVSKVWLTYTNSDGDEVSEDASLVAGNVTFSDLDLYVEKDDTATVTVSADLNTISSGQSTPGDHVRLDMAFNNFQALAESSGETYKADKIDAGVAAASDLDFGTPTWTVADLEVDVAIADGSVVLGSTFDAVVDDDDDATLSEDAYPVGTLLCFDDDATTCAGADTYGVVTAYARCTAAATPNASCVDATQDVYTVLWVEDAGTGLDLNDDILYSLPGDGYLTTTNPMIVYETLPTLTLASSSPSGTRTTSTDDTAFIFNVTADDAELVTVRAGLELTSGDGFDSAGANNPALAADVDAGDQIDGSSVKADLSDYLATDTVSLQASSDISGYNRVSFWMRWVDTDAGGTPPRFADFETSILAAATTNPAAEGVALSAALCGSDATGATPTLATGEWYRCDIAVASAAAGDDFFHVEIADATRLEVDGDGVGGEDDYLYFDDVLAYNDKIVIDMTSDGDVDTYANNTANAGSPSQADLKVGSTTKATGFWDSATNGASASSTATLTLIPTTAIEISEGDTETFDLHINSFALLHEDTGSDDPITLSMDSGSSSDTTVTTGDFWWYDSNVRVQWLGDVATKLNGNTIVY